MRRLSAGGIAGFAGSILAGAASAQPADAPPIDEIVVTGTRIPRKDVTAASPVASFNRDEVTEFGAVALEEFLNVQPQLKPDLGKSSNNPGDGTSSIDLRGLGRGRTLVLLNGRRLAPTGTGSSIDVNAIPSAMIERIEIVSGGASAVYGSDAVTGAVNFITRKNFTGVELSGQADVYGAGDGQVYNGSFAGGTSFAGGRGHIAAYADFLKREPVLQGDREFTAVVLGDFTGVLLPSGSTSVPAGRTVSGGPSLIFNPDGTVRPFVRADFFNFAPANYLQTPLERWSAGAFAEYEATADIDLYTEVMYSQPKTAAELAPALSTFTAPLVINGPFFAPSARPVLTARYDPDGDGLGSAQISKRFEDVGPRITGADRNYYRGVLGLRAAIAPAWSLDAFYSYANNSSRESLDNAVSLSRVVQGLRIDPVTGACVDPSNGCVAVNIFGVGNISSAAQDFITVDGLENRFSSVQHNAAVIATGDVLTWSQGTVKVSGGGEYRRNVASSRADPALAAGDAIGFQTFAGAEGAIDVYEAFGEILVPLLTDQPFARRLEIEAGGRYSQYSSAGGVWTWKAGGQWEPVSGLRLSGVWQRAVRAPNVEELFQVPVRNFGTFMPVDDFCAAVNDPIGSGLAAVCIAQGTDPAAVGVYAPPTEVIFDVVSGGNPDLTVERAGSINAGADYTFDLPVTLRVAIDYFSINITNAIASISEPVRLCAIVADPDSPICQATIRDPSGAPIEVSVSPVNVAAARASGLDLGLDFGAALPRAFGLGDDARIAVRSAATAYFELGSQQVANAPFIDCAGFFEPSCGAADITGISAVVTFPKYLVTSSFSVAKGPFTGSLRWRWISGTDNLSPLIAELGGQPPPLFAIDRVTARHYVDLAGSVDLFDRLTLRAGIDNVFLTDPPLLGARQVQANTDPSRYDVFGRRFYAGFDVRF